MDLLPDIINGKRRGYKRLAVDVGQTGFFEGREFRTFYEFQVNQGESQFFKFVCSKDFILFDLNISLDAGSLKLKIFSIGGTEGGTFNVPLPVFGKNRMNDRFQSSPGVYLTSVMQITTGGTYTQGSAILLDLFRIVTASATSQQRTVGGSVSGERGLPPGTYYIQLENFGNGHCNGVMNGFWEERD